MLQTSTWLLEEKSEDMEKLPHEKGFHISWEQIHRDSRALAWRLEKMAPHGTSWKAIVAVTRGGMVPAMVVARELDLRIVETISVKSYNHQVQSEAEILKSPAEALVSLSLVGESLIILGYLPSALLLPMISLHGYLIGGAIVGAEQSPLLSYFLGIFIGQGSLLLIVLYLSEHIGKILKNKNLVSGILIGIGAAFSWVALID